VAGSTGAAVAAGCLSECHCRVSLSFELKVIQNQSHALHLKSGFEQSFHQVLNFAMDLSPSFEFSIARTKRSFADGPCSELLNRLQLFNLQTCKAASTMDAQRKPVLVELRWQSGLPSSTVKSVTC
jgi:hypothetical protein